MPEITIEVQGLQGLLKDLDPKKVDRAMKVGMDGAMRIVRGDLKYPPKSEANQPRGFRESFSISTMRPHNSWYQRGLGTKYIRKDGSIRVDATSEKLGGSWSERVKHMGSVWYARLDTDVSYARYVHDSEKQPQFHKGRGWQTLQDIVRKRQKQIGQMFAQAIQREFKP